MSDPFGSFANKLEGVGTGGEVSAVWAARDDLDVHLFYSYLHLDIRPQADSTDSGGAAVLEGSSPRHQGGLRLGYRPSAHWQFDAFVRTVDRLPAFAIPGYSELSLRAAWRPLPELELALTGENLLHSQHAEFGHAPERGDPERSVWAELRWAWD